MFSVIADLASPVDNTGVYVTVMNARQYIDVTFITQEGRTPNAGTITDSAPEFSLVREMKAYEI